MHLALDPWVKTLKSSWWTSSYPWTTTSLLVFGVIGETQHIGQHSERGDGEPRQVRRIAPCKSVEKWAFHHVRPTWIRSNVVWINGRTARQELLPHSMRRPKRKFWLKTIMQQKNHSSKGGQGGKKCQAYLDKFFENAFKHRRGTSVLWIIWNLMMIDWSGKYQVLTDLYWKLMTIMDEFAPLTIYLTYLWPYNII